MKHPIRFFANAQNDIGVVGVETPTYHLKFVHCKYINLIQSNQ